MEYEATAEQPEVPDARAALVKQWCEKIETARKHWKDVFKAMRESQDFAMYGCDKAWRDGGNYTVPILPRYINQAVAQLYAKNPKAIFKRKSRLRYKMWDGRSDSLQSAMEMAQMGEPQSMALIQEVLAVRQNDLMLDRMGTTLELLYEYYLNEQSTNFKQRLKAAVRRVKTCKVAWIKLGYQRVLDERPEASAGIQDVTSKLKQIEALMQRAQAGKIQEHEAEAEKLRLNLADLQRDQYLVLRDGLVFDFPRANQILVDPECTHLKSLTGANWIAHEYEMTPERVKAVWGVDIGKDFTPYDKDDTSRKAKQTTDPKDCKARAYEVWDKVSQQVFVVVEGFKDFVKEPATPDIVLERFWPLFPIVFNEVEHDDQIYPMSDIEQAKDIQNEYNRSRQALREHRIAARPYWVEGAGMEDTDKNKLANHEAHAIISISTLGTGMKVEDVLQRGPTAPIDPNLYELESHFVDLTRVVGYQEAQLGSVSGATATESSIAQQSQSAAQNSDVDDLDEVLTELARSASQVMLMHVDKQTVVEIVGEGAVWPDMPATREEAAKELYLEIEAGSSGRPNKAADLANLERAMPMLIQLPGINPMPIGRKYLTLLDIDPEEGVADNLPSISAMNAILAKQSQNPGAQPTGDPQTDPGAQGGQGGQNAPAPNANREGPQPEYTAPNVPA